MRCPNCGGMPSFLCTTITGVTYYRCTTMLTTQRMLRGTGQIRFGKTCDTVCRGDGKHVVDANIAYLVNSKPETIRVIGGKLAW